MPVAAAVQFVGHLERELAGLRAQRETFEARFGASEFAAEEANWEGKIARARSGEQRWALITARKPQ